MGAMSASCLCWRSLPLAAPNRTIAVLLPMIRTFCPLLACVYSSSNANRRPQASAMGAQLSPGRAASAVAEG